MEIFGPNTGQVLTFLAGLGDLSPSDIGRVTNAWRESDERDRAEAWVRVHRALVGAERDAVLAAAAVARQEALAVARRYGWPKWPFWAAAADAGAGIAAGDRIGGHYRTLVAPLAQVMPWLWRSGGTAPTGGPIPDADHASGVLRQGA